MEGPEIATPLPKYWEPWDVGRENMKILPLAQTSDEFVEVFTQFRNSIHFYDTEKSLSLTPSRSNFTFRGPSIRPVRTDTSEPYSGHFLITL